MSLSVFDLFKIGIGPSSSHTVGPMWAALRFVRGLLQRGQLDHIRRVRAELYGSLALTGRGHATDTAILLGLSGEQPDTVDCDRVAFLVSTVRSSGVLRLAGQHAILFSETADLLFHEEESLPRHPNGMCFTGLTAGGDALACEAYYSVGGGFVVSEAEAAAGYTGGSAAQQPLHG